MRRRPRTKQRLFRSAGTAVVGLVLGACGTLVQPADDGVSESGVDAADDAPECGDLGATAQLTSVPARYPREIVWFTSRPDASSGGSVARYVDPRFAVVDATRMGPCVVVDYASDRMESTPPPARFYIVRGGTRSDGVGELTFPDRARAGATLRFGFDGDPRVPPFDVDLMMMPHVPFTAPVLVADPDGGTLLRRLAGSVATDLLIEWPVTCAPSVGFLADVQRRDCCPASRRLVLCTFDGSLGRAAVPPAVWSGAGAWRGTCDIGSHIATAMHGEETFLTIVSGHPQVDWFDCAFD